MAHLENESVSEPKIGLDPLEWATKHAQSISNLSTAGLLALLGIGTGLALGNFALSIILAAAFPLTQKALMYYLSNKENDKIRSKQLERERMVILSENEARMKEIHLENVKLDQEHYIRREEHRARDEASRVLELKEIKENMEFVRKELELIHTSAIDPDIKEYLRENTKRIVKLIEGSINNYISEHMDYPDSEELEEIGEIEKRLMDSIYKLGHKVNEIEEFTKQGLGNANSTAEEVGTKLEAIARDHRRVEDVLVRGVKHLRTDIDLLKSNQAMGASSTSNEAAPVIPAEPASKSTLHTPGYTSPLLGLEDDEIDREDKPLGTRDRTKTT